MKAETSFSAFLLKKEQSLCKVVDYDLDPYKLDKLAIRIETCC